MNEMEYGPDELDGHTLEELSDYLDAGFTPADPSIDDSPACQMALAALAHVKTATESLLETEADEQPPTSESFIAGILEAISMNVRAGRSIPIAHPSPTARITMTEGAVRSLIRGAGDNIDGVLVGRCTLEGDVTTIGTSIVVDLDITVRWGENLTAKAAEVRAAVAAALATRTDLVIEGIDVTATDVYPVQHKDGEDAE